MELKRYEILARVTNDCLFDWNIVTDSVWRSETDSGFLGHDNGCVRHDRTWWGNHVHPEDKQQVIEKLHQHFDDQDPDWCVYYRFRRSDGSYAVIKDHGKIFFQRDGTPHRIIGAMADISKTDELQKRLIAERRRAEAASKADHRLSHGLLKPSVRNPR